MVGAKSNGKEHETQPSSDTEVMFHMVRVRASVLTAGSRLAFSRRIATGMHYEIMLWFASPVFPNYLLPVLDSCFAGAAKTSSKIRVQYLDSFHSFRSSRSRLDAFARG